MVTQKNHPRISLNHLLGLSIAIDSSCGTKWCQIQRVRLILSYGRMVVPWWCSYWIIFYINFEAIHTLLFTYMHISRNKHYTVHMKKIIDVMKIQAQAEWLFELYFQVIHAFFYNSWNKNHMKQEQELKLWYRLHSFHLVLNTNIKENT